MIRDLESRAIHGSNVTGDQLVNLNELRTKLRPNAWAVWMCLTGLRDKPGADEYAVHAGEVHPGRGEIARRTGLKPKQVERAVDRLRAAGLLEPTRVWIRPLPVKGGHLEPMKAYYYPVRGGVRARALGEREPSKVWVTKATAAWLAKPETRGGKRVGAGRKADPTTKPHSGCGGNQKPGRQVIKNRAPMVLSKDKVVLNLENKMRGGRALFSFSRTDTGSVQPNPFRKLPPFPSEHLIGAAEVPPPPKLPVQVNAVADVQMLLRAYRSAVQHHYGQRVFNVMKIGVLREFTGDIVRDARGRTITTARELTDQELTEHRLFKRLRETAEAMRELSIAPAAWVAFIIYRHRTFHSSTKAPTIGHTFSAGAVRARAGWFLDTNAVTGRAAAYGPAVRAIYHAWRACDRDIRGGMTPEQVSAVVEKHFPGDRWNQLLRAARVESANTRRELQYKVEHGEFLW